VRRANLKSFHPRTLLALALLAVEPGCQRTPGDPAAQPGPAHAGPDWSKQSKYLYGLTLESRASLPSGNAAFALALEAGLQLRVLAGVTDGARVVGKLVQPVMKLGDRADTEAKKIAEELEDPVVFVLSKGRVTDSWFAPQLSGVSVSTWRTLFVALQLSEPAGSVASWEAEEFDSAGRYRAAYTRDLTTGAVARTNQAAWSGIIEWGGFPNFPQNA